jgi:hypothetical protein
MIQRVLARRQELVLREFLRRNELLQLNLEQLLEVAVCLRRPAAS